MPKQLRPYQQEAVTNTLELLVKSDEPILINASVGAGKSLIIADILMKLESLKKRILCLTNNAELVRNNAATFKAQGGNPSIYCAALGSKDISQSVVYGSPITIVNAIKAEESISEIKFSLIIVDEAHGINFNNKSSSYMRIFSHYKMIHPAMRIIGLTGTPYRGKGVSIVGENQFFKNQACDISASWLIERSYLARPYFGLPTSETIDFTKVKINALGKFDNSQLQEVVSKSSRLTATIMREVLELVDTKRNGAFIFASTKAHCQECFDALPRDTSAIITGDTPQEERIKILDLARNGFIKYLVNINVLTVGIDVPNFDTVVFVRPTESLVLYTQAIGRGLRLSPNKENCLVLDYAGNIERHGDIDNPIINEAIQPKAGEEEDYIIPCYHCNTLNKVLARRCIGMPNDARCDYYFDFKPCPHCSVQNDITARQCRVCQGEIIDPNKKLKKHADNAIVIDFDVIQVKYSISSASTGAPIVRAHYNLSNNKQVSEQYYLVSDIAKRTFYHSFVKKHFREASKVHRCLNSVRGMQFAISKLDIMTPDKVTCYVRPEGLKIKNKIFSEGIH